MAKNSITALATTDGTIVRRWEYPSADVNPARVYLASLAPGSRDAMQRSLEVVAGIALPGVGIDRFPWHLLRYQHTAAIRAVLAERYEYTTANKTLSALRQVIKNAWRLKLMTADEYMAAADVKSITGAKPDQAAGRAVASGELLALVAACDDGTAAGVRDAAMLGVAYAGGLRRAEIAGLLVDSFDAAASTLKVHGKRNATRTVPLPEGAVDAINDWLKIRGKTPGRLFTRIGKGDRVSLEGLTTQAVHYIFRERGKAARVKAFTPHDMRRSFAGDMLDAGVDIATVQKLMGHKNVNTTAEYDRRGERAKREASKKIHYPYQRRDG